MLIPKKTLKYIALGSCGFAAIGGIVIYFIVTTHVNYNTKFNNDDSDEKIEKKCREYEKLACEHKLPQNAAGGTEGLFPHMAFIIDKDKSESTFAGTLISDQFILTSANVPRKNAAVKLGSLTSKNDNTGEWFDVSDSYSNDVSPNKTLDYLDFTLLRLSRPVKFSPYIRPICLLTKDVFNQTENITASGWSTDEKDRSFQRLRVVNLRKTGDDVKLQCENELSKKENELPSWISSSPLISSLFYCSVHTLQGKTSCPRSIGGPVQYKTHSECPNTYTQLGMAIKDTFSDQCETKTAGNVVVLHLKLSHSLPWIAKTVWPKDT